MKIIHTIFVLNLMFIGLQISAHPRKKMVFPRNKPPSISQMVLENNGVCECGFFSSKNLLLSDDPLWIEFVMHTPCPTDKSCMTLCQILGMKVKVLEPERLCKRIQQNVHDVQISTYYRVCNSPWTYTKLTKEETICCLQQRSYSCVLEGDLEVEDYISLYETDHRDVDVPFK